MLHLILEYKDGESWLVGSFDFIEYSTTGELTCWLRSDEEGASVWATLRQGADQIETRLAGRVNPDAGCEERPYLSDRVTILPVE